MIAGSVLEEHLRTLALRTNVAVETPEAKPRKADTIDAELVKASTYNKLEQKSVTAWARLTERRRSWPLRDLRAGQVQAPIREVRAFMIRYRA